MEEYSAALGAQHKISSKSRCYEAWISFFTILNTLPKLEYSRYTEGFMLSIRNTTDLSFSTILQVILTSPILLCRVQKSVKYLDLYYK